MIDRVPGLDNAWLTSGHFRTGILNAPATAAVLARWIAAGEPPAEPATWAASRFATAPAAIASGAGQASLTSRRSPGSRCVTPARSRYSSSGITTRRGCPAPSWPPRW